MKRLDEFRSTLAQFEGSLTAIDARHGARVISLAGELAAGRDVVDAQLVALGRSRTGFDYGRSVQLFPSSESGSGIVALLSLHGVATYDLEYQPYAFSSRLFAETIEELGEDRQISVIVVDTNSPGGYVTGTPEAADAVWKARQKKPIVFIVNALCASAGYWIASQGSKIISVPSGDVGSIGVFVAHYDFSNAIANAGIKPTLIYAGEHKVEGNAMEPLKAEAQAWLQSEVDDTYSQFIAAVARGRAYSNNRVRETFGGGRCFGAEMALRVGMVDAIAPPSKAYQRAVRSAAQITSIRTAEFNRRRIAIAAAI